MTPKEISLIEKAACDLQTGNHLIRERTDEEYAMIGEVILALSTPKVRLTERQKEILEHYRLCTDYDYWKSKQPKENED